MDDVIRLILATALASMLMGLGERTTFDERGLRIAAAPAGAPA